jgi:MoaA/NifB/PqqE/SkfB family radical SAM enzyme
MIVNQKIPRNLLSQLGNNKIFPTDLVFYITSSCNLRCKHCYIGNEILNSNFCFDLQDSVSFINSFNQLDRITILGGEPFLYKNFDILLNSIKCNSINEFRITSNLTNISCIDTINNDLLNKIRICVSIDGHNVELHEKIRGSNTFNKTINNIKILLNKGIDVEVTHTLNSMNIDFFSNFIELSKSIGIKKINIHKVSLQGNAIANSSLAIPPSKYIEFCKKIELMQNNKVGISIRFPILYATKHQLELLITQENYSPHSIKSYYGTSHRIVVYPNRQIFISSELFGTESFIGTFDDEKFYFNQEKSNEFTFFNNNNSKSISDLNPMQSGDENYPYVLSVSYKKTINI